MKRGKPLKRVSAKRRAENDLRRQVVEQIVEERGLECEIKWDNECDGLAVDPHEKLTRARGGSITDPENILLSCRICHDKIDANPAEATRRGFLIPSWEAP